MKNEQELRELRAAKKAEFAAISSQHAEDQAAITKATEEFRQRQAKRQFKVTHLEGEIAMLDELLGDATKEGQLDGSPT